MFKVKALKTLKNANTIGAGDFFLAKFATSKKINMIERLFESNKFAYKKKLFGGYYNDSAYLVKYNDLKIVEVIED